MERQSFRYNDILNLVPNTRDEVFLLEEVCRLMQPLAQPRVNRLDKDRPFFTFIFYLFTKNSKRSIFYNLCSNSVKALVFYLPPPFYPYPIAFLYTTLFIQSWYYCGGGQKLFGFINFENPISYCKTAWPYSTEWGLLFPESTDPCLYILPDTQVVKVIIGNMIVLGIVK